MADLIGRQLGNYRLTKLLGSGGFAEVYLGEHVRLGMQAAIKVLHAHLAGDEAEAFQDEARVISELIHPHIIRVLDFDVENGTPFLVLDYAPQGSLGQRHKRGERVPLVQIVSYVEQVAEALQYAHDRKLVHRDVKPANMLVGRQGEILLSDFGIASVAHSTASMHTDSSPLGTLAYMAPEQIQGHVRTSSDQYALGVTVYQWLTGMLPFRGSSVELVGQQLGGTPTPLRDIAPDIAPAVEQVVLTTLAKDPHARFQSVQIFANELARASREHGYRTSSYYTATTVADTRKVPPVVLPSYATSPVLDAPEPVVHTPHYDAQTQVNTQPPERAQAYVNTTERVQPSPYLQPAEPYVPPEMTTQPRGRGLLDWLGVVVGRWIAFWLGLAVGGSLIVITSLSAPSSIAVELSIFVLPFFIAGWWAAQKTGLLRSSLFAALWAIFWLVLSVIPHFSSIMINAFLLALVLGLAISLIGGLIGRAIHRARQPIHSPAGGSRLR